MRNILGIIGQYQSELGLTLAIFLILLFSADLTWLISPPYWDSLLGNFREGLWLYHNNWNYKALALDQAGYAFGGPRVYFISIYPSLIALLYTITSSPTSVFIVLHLLSLAAAIGLIFCFWKLISILNISLSVRYLTLLVLVTSPVFLAQTMAMNAEIPIAFAALASLLCVLNCRFYTAAIIVGCAFLLKANAAVLGASYAAIVIISGYSKSKFGIVKVVCSFLIPLCLYHCYVFVESNYFKMPNSSAIEVSSSALNNALACWLSACGSPKGDYLVLAPDIFLLSKICAIVGIYLFIKICLLRRKAFRFFSTGQATAERQQMVSLACGIIVAVYYAAMSIWSVPLPRYLVVVLAPCLLVLVTISMPRMLRVAVLVLLLSLNVFNYKGDIYAAFLKERYVKTNTGASLETSLRQQLLIHRDIEVARKIESMAGSLDIIATWPYSLLLSDPLYGYVQHGLSVCSIKATTVFANTPRCSGTTGSLFVFGNNVFSRPVPDSIRKAAQPQSQSFGVLGDQHALTLYHLESFNSTNQALIDAPIP